jgi:DNA repair protein RadD
MALRAYARPTASFVHGEIVESLWEEDFTSVEDTQIVDDLRERLKLLGLDASKAEEMVRMAQQAPMPKGAAAQPFAIQPQREWEEARRRTQEQAKRLANILLNHVELTQAGTELVYKYKSLRLIPLRQGPQNVGTRRRSVIEHITNYGGLR